MIDNKVCHPRNNDFYMCAHAGMIVSVPFLYIFIDFFIKFGNEKEINNRERQGPHITMFCMMRLGSRLTISRSLCTLSPMCKFSFFLSL